MFISTNEDLATFCERAKKSDVVAVDTEFLREKTYHPLLCLVQVATHDESAVVDAITIKDLSPLVGLLEDESVTKVFHACDQDLEVLLDSLGCMPRPLFDTQLAASFLGYRMQMGYGALVQAYDGVHLAKADGLTDWSKRPLDQSQLKYAEEDVVFLPGIYDRMMRELIKRDRLGWFQPELDALCNAVEERRNPRVAYMHLKRASSLTRRQLAVAREVCVWREEAAARRNLPRKWMISDELVVEICRRAPHSTERLRRIRGLDSLSDRDAKQVIQAVERGERCEPADYPSLPHRPRPNAETDSVVDLMYALLRILSDRCGVAVPLIATRTDLVSFAQGNKTSPLRSGWRNEVAGQRLEKLLAGELGLTIKDGRVEIL